MNLQKNKNVLIIGTGLIGGSFARALYKKKFKIFGIVESLYQYNKNKEFNKIFEECNILRNSRKLIEKSDIIIIATPFFAYKNIIKHLSKYDLSKKIVFECGSVKFFVENVKKKYRTNWLNLTHPIAGSEKNGFENSSETLFKKTKIILDKNNIKNYEIKEIYTILGTKNFEIMSCKKHDEIYALTSHFPQFLAYFFDRLVQNDASKSQSDAILQKSCEKYKKFRRLSYSNKKIWLGKSGILTLNKKFIIENFKKFITSNFFDLDENLLSSAQKISKNYHKSIGKQTKYLGQGGRDFASLSK